MIRKLLSILLMAVVMVACDRIDDNRIPPGNGVYISFTTSGDWITYGVNGAGEWKVFRKRDRIPANFPYKALTETGFGGVLLLMDYFNQPHAYDTACPVEVNPFINVYIDSETHQAVCPECGSHYDVFENFGRPVSGPAQERNYGLTRYYVGPGRYGDYMMVSL